MIVETVLGQDIIQTKCQTFVIPVNKVGTMGKGLALYFAKRFPSLVPTYRRFCYIEVFDKDKIAIADLPNGKKVLFFPTKDHWREKSTYNLIEEGLEALANRYLVLGIESIAIPRLGCGEGGLDFDEVLKLIYKHLDKIPLRVVIYG